MGLIDAHTHIFPPGQTTRREDLCAHDATFAEIYSDPKAKMGDAPALLRALDEAGIEAAVVAGFAFSHEREIDEQNEYILAAAAESRIIGSAGHDRALTPGPSPAAAGEGSHASGKSLAENVPALTPGLSPAAAGEGSHDSGESLAGHDPALNPGLSPTAAGEGSHASGESRAGHDSALTPGPSRAAAGEGSHISGESLAGHDRALTPGPSPAAAGEGSGLVRGRIMALASINPALAGWERTLARALDGGARGFGELRPHNQGWEPLGAEAMRFYAAADGAGAVLLWHVTEPVGHVYPGKGGGISPAELARVAEAFPALRMVAAHMGGGLAFFLQMPELRVALANVYFDTAAYPLLYDDASVARLVDLAGPERVIFGSDYPLLSPRRQLERIKPLLPPDAVRAVCGDTAGSLFRDIREQ